MTNSKESAIKTQLAVVVDCWWLMNRECECRQTSISCLCWYFKGCKQKGPNCQLIKEADRNL